ncbi:MAG: DUF1015 domain-containing protein [Oscillospiraceae bacterium]|nr:DUF1015 domain-containing protein [Oscillospiraceae bacterium]
MCFKETDILLPKRANDPDFMEKWAVIACDQYTSDISYWEKTKDFVGGAVSALDLIFPEIYLELESQGEQKKRIGDIAGFMDRYEKDLECHENSMFYIERTLKNGSVRQGLVGAVDLEEYDCQKDSKAKIRPTEKTVPERIPPRVKIRERARFELPHAMVLFADENEILMPELKKNAPSQKKLYDFELMHKSGRVKCHSLDAENIAFVKQTLGALEKSGFMFAVGDGNHSLATAKECWEDIKKTLPPGECANHPARYALAEIVNIYDKSLEFEPIYRIMFEVDPKDIVAEMKKFFVPERKSSGFHEFEAFYGKNSEKISVSAPEFTLPVESLQLFLDDYKKRRGGKIDYVHGKAETVELAQKEGTIGFVFDTMKKSDLFSAIEKGGVLPRKTFSMGEADDKRFYIECRRIKRND